MDEALFWRLIENTRRDSGGDAELQAQSIAVLLSMKSKEDVVRFGTICHTKVAGANLPWVFVAVQWILRASGMPELSMDGWTAWRSGLVARGRGAYDAAISDPDVLADQFTDLERFLGDEALLYVAHEGYRLKTRGKELPDDAIEVRDVFDSSPDYPTDDELRDFDLAGRFPRIQMKFGPYPFLDPSHSKGTSG